MSGNPNPAFITVPGAFGAYDSRLITNTSPAPINTSQVVNAPNYGFYAFSTIGASRSAAPPANYPAVAR